MAKDDKQAKAQAEPDERADPGAPELPAAVPDRGAPVAPATAWGKEKTVNMIFPKRVTLTRDDHVQVQFAPGVHPVGEKYADHWYLKAHGVKRA